MTEFFEHPDWYNLPLSLFALVWLIVFPIRLIVVILFVLFCPYNYQPHQFIEFMKFES
jgi:hypothetical protein